MTDHDVAVATPSDETHAERLINDRLDQMVDGSLSPYDVATEVLELFQLTLLPEIVEIPDHPWFIGVQFHPELKSRPFEPHPLFASFIEAAVKQSRLV